MAFDPDNLDEIIAAINKKFQGDLRMGDSYEHPSRISTRSLALDVATGGGIPQGRISRIYGAYSTGKSLTGWNIIAEAQALGLECCYWNIEKQYDPEFARDNMGVDISSLRIMEGTEIEDIGEKMEGLLSGIQVHVVDSCSAAVSVDEMEASVSDWRPGITARAWGKVFRRIGNRFDHTNNTIVLLDQVRTNFKTSAEEPPGGRIIDHASSMSLKLKKSSWLFYNGSGYLDPKAKGHKSEMSDDIDPDGVIIKARVEKSRVCRPHIPATLRLDYRTGQFDTLFEYAEAAKAYGVVDDRGGGNYYYPAVEKNGEKQRRLYGENVLRDFIKENPLLQKQIRRVAIERAKRH